MTQHQASWSKTHARAEPYTGHSPDHFRAQCCRPVTNCDTSCCNGQAQCYCWLAHMHSMRTHHMPDILSSLNFQSMCRTRPGDYQAGQTNMGISCEKMMSYLGHSMCGKSSDSIWRMDRPSSWQVLVHVNVHVQRISSQITVLKARKSCNRFTLKLTSSPTTIAELVSPKKAPCKPVMSIDIMHAHGHVPYAMLASRHCMYCNRSGFPVSLSFQIVDFSHIHQIGRTSCQRPLARCNVLARQGPHLQFSPCSKFLKYAVKVTKNERSGTLLNSGCQGSLPHAQSVAHIVAQHHAVHYTAACAVNNRCAT